MKKKIGFLLAFIFFSAFASSAWTESDTIIATTSQAFPTAEGFGANTPGGRASNTEILFVTNTNDSGTGSLRAAIEAWGPRIVIFRTGGTIELLSSLELRNPYITIAGQTAPGGGIAIRNAVGTKTSTLKIKTHDVIIRGLRIRPGAGVEIGDEPDGIWIDGTYSHDVILDHTSVSWAVDENLTVSYGAYNVSIQWCIISEGLRSSTHSKGFHSRGFMIGSSTTDATTRVSAHHNLLAHNRRRMPFIQGEALADFVNNTIYNWGNDDSPLSYAGRINNNAKVNYVGNHITPGPNSNDAYAIESTSGSPQIYVEGNYSSMHRTQDTDPENAMVTIGDRKFVVEYPFSTTSLQTQSATDAHQLVLAQAGAIMPMRDSVDARVASDAENGTGSIIDDPSEVGGWPTLAAGTPPTDSDNDGMPDDFEDANGLDPNDPLDALDTGLSRSFTGEDGYLNVEVYINCLFSGNLTPVSVTGASVDSTLLTLEEGRSFDLTETFSPANASNKSVTWSSSNASVATVNSSGLVTAVSIGSATITLTTNDGSLTANCSVIVNAATFYLDFEGYKVSVSSMDSDNVPLNTRDDDLGSKWVAKGDEEWIKFDMQQTKTVDNVEIAFYNGDITSTSIDIQISTDDVNWTNLFSGYSSGSSLDLETFDFTNTDGRYIRIVGHGTSYSDWNIFTEIKINLVVEVSTNNLNFSDKEIKLYPNPTADQCFTIDLSDFSKQDEFNISIFDVSGRVVYSNNVIGGELHQINGLQSTRLYFVKVKSKEINIVKKLIVE